MTAGPSSAAPAVGDVVGTSVVAADGTTGAAGVGATTVEELMQFRRWSMFFARAASAEIQQNAVYVRARSSGNPQFFEQTRHKLIRILHECDLHRAMGSAGRDTIGHEEVVEALELVLEAQCTALGFLCIREFHKAQRLGELCVSITDALAYRSGGKMDSLLFWRLLTRANLGGSFARFNQTQPQSRAVLQEALEMAEDPEAPITARERVVAGACYTHLGKIAAQMGDYEEAQRHADQEIELFERFIWELPETKEDREVVGAILATAYSSRGFYDMQSKKFETALMWYNRAQECVQKYADLNGDSEQLASDVRNYIEMTKVLQGF